MPEPRDQDPVAERAGDGVDLTLIRGCLALAPAQRLEFVDDRCADIERIRKHLGGNQNEK